MQCVQLRLLEDCSVYVIDVIGILLISDDVVQVEIIDIVKKFGFNRYQFYLGYGQMDLFIGIDQVKFYIGEIRKFDNLIVWYLLLGWVVFGVIFGQLVFIYVYYIKLEVFVDLVVFWFIESMGVVVKVCICEVEKFS